MNRAKSLNRNHLSFRMGPTESERVSESMDRYFGVEEGKGLITENTIAIRIWHKRKLYLSYFESMPNEQTAKKVTEKVIKNHKI